MYQILGEGWYPMFTSDSQKECMQWVEGYLRDGWGSWNWFTLTETETDETLKTWSPDNDY